MSDCIFCKIVNHEAPARIVYEDELVMAILDNDPISAGHTLILPKKDIQDIHTLDEEVGFQVMKVTRLVAGAIEKEFGYDGSMIMEVNGIFQDVPHFHLHVFGRMKNNDITIVYPDYNTNDKELDSVVTKLQQAIVVKN